MPGLSGSGFALFQAEKGTHEQGVSGKQNASEGFFGRKNTPAPGSC
jgi:hypothetical protein